MAAPTALPAALLILAPLLLQESAPGEAPPPSPVARVVAAVAAVARENAALPEKERVSGDPLFDGCVRAAAAAAPGDPRSFLLGLAHALDPGRTLAKLNLTAGEFAGVETEEARKARLAALGKPSLRGRNDLALHFAVSAALALHTGEEFAETLGLAKERMDALRKGGSGLSFADLLADYAGIRFAAWLADGKEGAARLAKVAAGFTGSDFLPDPSKEEEGLTWEEFAKRFGDFPDERFLAEKKRLGEAIEALAVYAPEGEEKGGEPADGGDGG